MKMKWLQTHDLELGAEMTRGMLVMLIQERLQSGRAPLLIQQTGQVVIDDLPFAEGALRMCYRMQAIHISLCASLHVCTCV